MKRIVLIFAILILGATALAQEVDTAGAGWWTCNGLQYSGVEYWDGKWGAFISGGRWIEFSPAVYLVLPATAQFAASPTGYDGMVSVSPQIMIGWKRFLFGFSPGVATYFAKGVNVGYTKLEGSVSFVVSKMQDGDNVAITLAGQYIPGNKRKALMVGLTLFH